MRRRLELPELKCLRQWQPKQKIDGLLPEDSHRWFIKASLWGGYRLGQWLEEHPMIRARVMAAYFEDKLREAWNGECIERASKTKKSEPSDQFSRQWAAWSNVANRP